MRTIPTLHIILPGLFFHLNRPPTLGCKPNLSMDVIQPTLPQPFQNRIYHNQPTCPNQENPPTLPYNCPITHLSLLSFLMLLSAILVLLLILISHSPTTSPPSPAPASCTYATSAASDPCLTLKLHPPLWMLKTAS